MTGRGWCWAPAVWALSACAAPIAQPPAGARPAMPEAATARLISTEELARRLASSEVLLIDVRTDPFIYLKGHIPGAEYLNTETLRASDGGLPLRLLSAGTYAELFSRLGIDLARPVVIYSAGETRNIDATFLALLLGGFGHREVDVLDGGYFKWTLEQRPVAQRYPRIPRSRFPAESFHPDTASLSDVRQAVQTGGALLVDARSPEQYAGEAGAQMRRGHIPGAISHSWGRDLTEAESGHVWRPLEELRSAYEAQGITPDKTIIVYCNAATEASHVYFTLHELLGYPRVRVYVGSWTEWAELDSLPITAGSQP